MADRLANTKPMAASDYRDVATLAVARDPITANFLTAGKAIFTVSNPEGEHYTYRIEKPADFKGEYFCSLMAGTSNEHDYAYVGMMNEFGQIRLTRGSKFPQDSQGVKVLAFALRIAFGKQAVPAGYALQHAGQCARCARTLTAPESLKVGIGPECLAAMGHVE